MNGHKLKYFQSVGMKNELCTKYSLLIRKITVQNFKFFLPYYYSN